MKPPPNSRGLTVRLQTVRSASCLRFTQFTRLVACTIAMLGATQCIILPASGQEPITTNEGESSQKKPARQPAEKSASAEGGASVEGNTSAELNGSTEADASPIAASAPATVEEARIRARILHEAFGGALQVMHRDYFRENQKLTLPSRSLEDVFAEMARSQGVQLRWLAVNARAMSIDHKPQNEFERSAVAALSAGKPSFESATAESYQFVGPIHLSASCVKCHVRNRTSNESRRAGLVITMPIRKPEPAENQ